MIRRLRSSAWAWLLAVIVLVLIVIGIATTPGFATAFNISNSISLMSEKGMMLLPLALLIIAREIDISVASTAALAAVAAASAAPHGVVAAVTAALAVGVVCGAINGAFVVGLGLPSLLVTLGTLALYRGLCYVFLGGTPITAIPGQFITFGNGTWAGGFLPLDIIPFVALAPIFLVVLQHTAAGRRIYAIGGNPDTARYAGVRTARIRFLLFVVSGAVSSIGGLITIGRTAQASPDALLGYELDAITVIFLGGVSFLGGKGRMMAVYWAFVLLIAVRSYLQLNNASGYVQGTAVGLLLILSLLLSNIVQNVSVAVRTRRSKAGQLDAPNSLEDREEPLTAIAAAATDSPPPADEASHPAPPSPKELS